MVRWDRSKIITNVPECVFTAYYLFHVVRWSLSILVPSYSAPKAIQKQTHIQDIQEF